MHDPRITKLGHRPSDAALAAVDRVMIDQPWNMRSDQSYPPQLVTVAGGYKRPVAR